MKHLVNPSTLTLIACLVSVIVTEYVEVRLTHGRTPFEGTVELRGTNSDWRYICTDSFHWNLTVARAICRKLGFVSAMWHNSTFSANHVTIPVCRITCNPISDDVDDCAIDWGKENDCPCTNGRPAGVTCYFPGYYGRFRESLHASRLFQKQTINHGVTIQTCLEVCRENGEELAGLESSDECYCADEGTNYDKYGEVVPGDFVHESIQVEYKTMQCSGDVNQGCGGHLQLDVYESSVGSCGFNASKRHGFVYSPNFPGISPINTKCTWKINPNSTTPGLGLKFLQIRQNEGDSLRLHYGTPGQETAIVDADEDKVFEFPNTSEVTLSLSTGDSNYSVFLMEYFSLSVSCGVPPVIDFAFHVGTEYTVGKTVQYRCVEGYDNSVHSERNKTCIASGKWHGRDPQCIHVMALQNQGTDSTGATLALYIGFAVAIGLSLLMVIILCVLIYRAWRQQRETHNDDASPTNVISGDNDATETTDQGYDNPTKVDGLDKTDQQRQWSATEANSPTGGGETTSNTGDEIQSVKDIKSETIDIPIIVGDSEGDFMENTQDTAQMQ
ncbi:uncharacterized protein [Ptychodera flava]|uniref:uncharacterized protein n=1 Tax=Ptychodera flava TaxID=63121 RepID=UPI00396A18BD